MQRLAASGSASSVSVGTFSRNTLRNSMLKVLAVVAAMAAGVALASDPAPGWMVRGASGQRPKCARDMSRGTGRCAGVRGGCEPQWQRQHHHARRGQVAGTCQAAWETHRARLPFKRPVIPRVARRCPATRPWAAPSSRPGSASRPPVREDAREQAQAWERLCAVEGRGDGAQTTSTSSSRVRAATGGAWVAWKGGGEEGARSTVCSQPLDRFVVVVLH